jgi:hypothetical protein
MILAALASLILSLAQADKPIPEPAAPPCALPAIDPASRLVFAGFNEGAGLSTVAVAGQDAETTVGDVHIAPGRERLTLVFASHDPIIYRFSGATGRVARLILLHGEGAGAGATGLPRARIAFGSAAACGLSYSIYDDRDGREASRARALFGRAPDVTGGLYALHWALIGSERIIPARIRSHDGGKGGLEGDLNRFYSLGMIALDPGDVVASRPPELYQVLPSTAGILQLLREGALVPATPGDGWAWIAAAVRSQAYSNRTLFGLRQHVQRTAYRVVRPIRLPAHLCGAHSVLLFAPDPSFVSGDLCHSDVFFADGTGRGSLTSPDRRP